MEERVRERGLRRWSPPRRYTIPCCLSVPTELDAVNPASDLGWNADDTPTHTTCGRWDAGTMFEKSLYDLIKGLRNHKGSEDEYIQDCLRECKVEIKSQDMDKKATALLKLIYLEMFGYDMSWASFHVLEVMSSNKYLQKRVGYLGAVQSFRPDTEVLMLATNMLKKDIVSPNIPALSLPLVTLPHIVTPSLAMSLLPDILSRLSHSSPVVRKKTVVCLYRLALVYPEALKLAWPKIKDHLMDDQEDSSVTTAAINVICELGWRRPHDFLPLAPRFFELLVDSGNNWMAIKVIKLFATLTPLEPRLTRKLLRPLTNIIQTTAAMSLLYECINGIIQGGILDGEDNLQERDEVATLCVGKLRGMIVIDADPNLKYVALLALNRIITTHPMLVTMQQDVIMDCLDDPDISIRLQALELAVGMVMSDTLQLFVDRLMEQLRVASSRDTHDVEVLSDQSAIDGSEGRRMSSTTEAALTAPNDYRTEVIHRILDICSQNNYSSVIDFEWYVGILVQLVGLLPPSDAAFDFQPDPGQEGPANTRAAAALRIGSEIRNVAVRVKGVRPEATRAAESLLLLDNRSNYFPVVTNIGHDVLGPVAWVAGEYAEYLMSPRQALRSLIDLSNVSLHPRTLQLFLQSIPKVFSQANRAFEAMDSWKNEMSLLLTRVVDFLEALAAHPDLDVQERAIEFLEVLRLGGESLRSETHGVPFFLASIIPSLFMGLELNPVAISAQRKVVLPDELQLDEAFNGDLLRIFEDLDDSRFDANRPRALRRFYHVPDRVPSYNKPHHDLAPTEVHLGTSYQNTSGLSADASAVDKRRAERRERYRDDPFYIAALGPSDTLSPANGLLWSSRDEALDIDSIPIVDLKLEEDGQHGRGNGDVPRSHQFQSKRMEVATDETFGSEESLSHDLSTGDASGSSTLKRSPLQVDSSGLGHLPLTPNCEQGLPLTNDEDVEMKNAMQNVEQIRLRMQRASERIQLEGTPAEGTLVKKKKSKKQTGPPLRDGGQSEGKKKRRKESG
ncbi:uncharacterized protein N7459_002138 [Penicillium hispanicum]|uniref:uncharacterized protein n=1 Tax=Penicillium hispanicum TaxID=1080232 RepID=UPI002540C50F|nr:uncharacterized protein N7459_002138 [Penicillium hispanicum]KAJ5591769.1 hypothetical protein N7459_002138 [Penicillium hispanicum]